MDVMPEETLGPFGLLDDLDDVMAEVYTESRAAVGKDRKAILRMAGLSR
jgi:hypothetical protein